MKMMNELDDMNEKEWQTVNNTNLREKDNHVLSMKVALLVLVEKLELVQQKNGRKKYICRRNSNRWATAFEET